MVADVHSGNVGVFNRADRLHPVPDFAADDFCDVAHRGDGD